MAQFATVVAITGSGTVFAVDAQGVSRAVKVGDALLKDEIVRTVGDANVELLMEDGSVLAVAPAQSVRLDDNVTESDQRPTAQDSVVATSATAETIIDALERGSDLSQTLDPTAAGLSAGSGANNGSSFVQLLRISEGLVNNATTAAFVAPDETMMPEVVAVPPQAVVAIASTATPTITSVEPGAPGTSDNNVVEGQALVYTVTLSAPTTVAASYAFNLGGGSATAGADYNTATVFTNGVTYDSATGQITVPVGVSDFTVTVNTLDDTVVDSATVESLPLTIGGVLATGGIIDNDQPTITSVEPGAPGTSDNNVVEGQALVYTVTLSAPTTVAASYAFNLGGGSATAGADYNTATVFTNGVTYDSATGQITVPVGVSDFTVTVNTLDDTVVDSATVESLPLTIGGVLATGGIIDNDVVHVTITGVAISSSFSDLSIYSGAYLSAGADAVVNGGIMTGGYTSLGAGSTLAGNIFSGGYTSTGASAVVTGDVLSGGYVTAGASSTISGAIAAVAAITPFAGGSQEILPAATMVGQQADAKQLVIEAQNALNAMPGTALAEYLGNETLFAGVYKSATLNTVAGTTLTLDGQGLINQTWVFNVADILALGANTKIVLINAGENATVLWNASGYASIGADAQILGTVFAYNYISVGANTIVTGPNGTNGGLFTQTNYMTFGAGVHVGSAGTTAAADANHVTGTAEANSLVTIHSEHSVLGTVTADSAGDFSYTLTTVNVSTLGLEANKTITASITDTAGDTVTSTAFIYNDQLGGSFGNDTLTGSAGIDTIQGGIGNDTLQGGTGNDMLIGGDGADVFKWSLAETGADVIKDFNLAPVASGGDMLDLKDLLVGENATASSLESFLHFSANTTTGQAVITVDANGLLPGGAGQTITLENVQFTALQTYAGGGGSDAAILTKLLSDGHLKTDV